jgi:hypothetical protein
MATARTTPHAQSWATGAFLDRDIPVPPAKPTAFELMTEELGLSGAPLWMWSENPQLRRWVKSNRNSKFVPEELLNLLGLRVLAEDQE